MEFDFHSHSRVFSAIPNSTLVAGPGTLAGASIDTAGFGSLEFIVQLGALTLPGTSVLLIQESDTGAFSGEETNVPISETLGVAIVLESGDAGRVFRLGSIGKKRFQRIVLVASGSPAYFIGAVAVLATPNAMPQEDQS